MNMTLSVLGPNTSKLVFKLMMIMLCSISAHRYTSWGYVIILTQILIEYSGIIFAACVETYCYFFLGTTLCLLFTCYCAFLLFWWAEILHSMIIISLLIEHLLTFFRFRLSFFLLSLVYLTFCLFLASLFHIPCCILLLFP